MGFLGWFSQIAHQDSRGRNQHCLGRAAMRLKYRRLPGNEGLAARQHMHSGHAMAADKFQKAIVGIEGIEDTQFGANRIGCFILILIGWYVQATRDASAAVTVDQPGCDFGGVDHREVGWQFCCCCRANTFNFSIRNDNGRGFEKFCAVKQPASANGIAGWCAFEWRARPSRYFGSRQRCNGSNNAGMA